MVINKLDIAHTRLLSPHLWCFKNYGSRIQKAVFAWA